MSGLDLRILLVDPPTWLPEQYKDEDEGFSFDIDVDTSIAITKQNSEADTVGVIRQDTVRNFTLPNTEKNFALIGPVSNPNNFNFVHEAPIKVKIFVNLYELPENNIVVRGTGDKPYEVEAFGESSEWVKALAELPISELDYGTTPPYNWELVLTIHQQRHYYQDGELPIFVPIANYGRRLVKNRIAVEDLRIWFSPLFILKEAFCRIGYQFVCPILETEFGRRIWTYILAENYGQKNISTNQGFNAVLTADIPMSPLTPAFFPGVVFFDNDSISPGFDNGGFYNTITGQYTGVNFTGDFKTIVEVDGVHTPGIESVVLVVITLFEVAAYPLNRQNIKLEAFGPLDTGSHVLEVSIENLTIASTQGVEITVLHSNFPGVIKKDTSRFWNVPKSDIIREGDLVDLQLIIDPSIKALEYLKGIAHLLDLKYETNSTTRAVHFYPEDGALLYNEGAQEAFFRENKDALNWTDKVKCRSLDADVKLNKNKQNTLLEFINDSADTKADSTGFEFPLHSKNIDFGSNFTAGTTKSTNPFFAPTINAFDWDIAWQFPDSSEPDAAPWIPFLWDGDVSSGVLPPPSTKITPRVLLSWTQMRMQVPPYEENSSLRQGDIRIYEPDFPNPVHQLAFYAPAAQIFPKDFWGIPPIGPFDPIPLDNESIVYGTDEYNPSLPGIYELFYKPALKRLYTVIPLGFLIKISFLDFINFSLRDKIFVKYFSEKLGEISFYSRALSVTDFVLNKDIPTPVLLQPSANRLDVDCCNCAVIVDFLGQGFETSDFNAVLVGECGEVLSFQWELILFDGTVANIFGSSQNQVVSIFAQGAPETWHYTVKVNVGTTCGGYLAEYTIKNF